MQNCFVPADILLPGAATPLDPWACIAVDQFTSQPEYWQKAEELAKGKPSTLHIVLPEAYLGTPQEESRLAAIRAAMQDYRDNLLTRCVHGYVYVERTQMDGTIRQGLVGAVDLEQYSFKKGSKPAIRPSESTVVARIPPRLKIRRGAQLETPHVMMLADDEACTLIEPIAAHKAELPLLYDGALMLNGGHLAGWAVEDPALVEQINTALANLGDAAAFAARWPAAAGQPPMTLAVGDGNHSLATAKAYWEELKPTLPPEQQQTHPARWCLAEVCNVHSPAIEIELCAPLGIAVTIVDMAQYGGQTVSSTRIRAALEEGRIEDANAMLGAPYCIDWPVRHGKGIGTSKLGKPTINQNYPADALQPCTGVYLTRIWLDGRWWPSATGIGRRPTVDAANAPVTCETYVPGYHGDTYGQTPVLEFHHYLCAVRKFGTLQELADLIETAAQQSIAYFAAKEEA